MHGDDGFGRGKQQQILIHRTKVFLHPQITKTPSKAAVIFPESPFASPLHLLSCFLALFSLFAIKPSDANLDDFLPSLHLTSLSVIRLGSSQCNMSDPGGRHSLHEQATAEARDISEQDNSQDRRPPYMLNIEDTDDCDAPMEDISWTSTGVSSTIISDGTARSIDAPVIPQKAPALTPVSSSAVVQSPAFRFLDLPTEVQAMIVPDLLPAAKVIIKVDREGKNIARSPGNVLLKVSKGLREKFSNIYYHNTTYVISYAPSLKLITTNCPFTAPDIRNIRIDASLLYKNRFNELR